MHTNRILMWLPSIIIDAVHSPELELSACYPFMVHQKKADRGAVGSTSSKKDSAAHCARSAAPSSTTTWNMHRDFTSCLRHCYCPGFGSAILVMCPPGRARGCGIPAAGLVQQKQAYSPLYF